MHSLDLADHMRVQTHHGTTWVDVQSPSKTTLAKLEQEYKLHPVHVQESLQKVQHNQVEREDNYLFLVMHYISPRSQANDLSFGQIGIFLGKNFLITIRSAASPSVEGFFNDCEKHEDHGASYFAQGAGYVLYMVISKLLDEIFSMTDRVVSELDGIESLVFDNSASDAERIGKARQKIVKLRRVIGPKRQILQDLTDQIDSFTGKNLSKRYSNITKIVNRLWEEIEEAKETVEIYKDADFTISTERTNEVLAVLTILFTFTIPITVVGAVYGMNVPLPGGVTAKAWTFWGRYTTFIVYLVASSLVALGMYLYFKKKKWF